MALINFLKFDSDRGAIITDEEYWNVHFRKRMHGDNLHPLLTEEQSQSIGVQAIYGCSGYPALHKETLVRVIHRIPEYLAANQSETPIRIKDLARIVFDELTAVIRLRIDQKMRFYYGFGTDDLNRGFFIRNAQTIPIKTEHVREAARKLADHSQKDTLLKAVFEAKAAVFGYDQDGITGYHLSPENSILGYVHEGFEAIGSGKYASGIVLGASMKSRNLQMRQAGYEPGHGLFELIDSAIIAGDHFREVGGNYQMILLDRSGHSGFHYREIFDHRAKLATEIVRAANYSLLEKPVAYDLLSRLILDHAEINFIESELFNKVQNPVMFHFLLRNYKLEETMIMASEVTDDHAIHSILGETK